MSAPGSAVLAHLAAEVADQDARHPAGYPPTRDGLRLGLAALEDETREALAEWNEHKRDLAEGARTLYAELLQAAAVAIRTARSVREAWMRPVSTRPFTPYELADQAIGLFLEYRDVHGYTEADARAAAALEVAEGAAVTDADLGSDQ